MLAKISFVNEEPIRDRNVDAEETPASMLYVVKGESEHLIPAVPQFILKIDAERQLILVHMIEGL